MRTLQYNFVYKFWLVSCIAQVGFSVADFKEYTTILRGKSGNIFDFILFSVNHAYFIALVGPISLFCLMKCYTTMDVIVMNRFHKKKDYFYDRLGCGIINAMVWVIITMLIRLIVGMIAGYGTDYPFTYYVEFNNYNKVAYIIVLQFTLFMSAYLIAFIWVREIIQDFVSNQVLRSIVPLILSIIELAIYKSLNYTMLVIFPLGNTLINSEVYVGSFFNRIVYWAFVLYSLYYIKTEFLCDKEITNE